ncbi:MAG: T9SS type A sorting domain-containing protein, partial [Bacteroidota bacterium]
AWFGSYFGDYDYPDAFMRSHLGSGTVLSSVWAGAPHWHFHAMGMGFPLAESTLATQNNDSIYHAGVSSRSIHINLLGDPTLKSYVFKGPADLEIEPGQGAAALTWSLPDELPLGFYIYRRINAGSPFELIDSVSENTNSYTDKCLGASTEYQYLIRSFRLESTPSGSFYNLSTGPTTAIFISDDNQVVSDFTALAQDSNFISLQSTALNADSLLWILPDGSQPSSSQINFTLEEGDNLIRLIAINSCGSDTSSQSFTLSGLNSLEESSFSIYPNPASSQVWVDLPEKAQRLRLYSLEGQLIRDIPVESSLKFKLDISNLTESNYIIEILLSDGRRSSQQLTISN